MVEMPGDQTSGPRQLLAVVASTVALTVAVLLGASIMLGVFAALSGGTARPVVGTVLLVVTVVATAGGTARLLAGRVAPRLAAPAYVRCSPRRARNLVWVASLLAGLVCAVITSGEGLLASLSWLAAVTVGGAVGAAMASRGGHAAG